jgi:hypothetical protein
MVLQSMSFPCLIDVCGVITEMMHGTLFILVICLRAFHRIILLSDMAGSVCLQTEWHLRQAVNRPIIQGMSGVD